MSKRRELVAPDCAFTNGALVANRAARLTRGLCGILRRRIGSKQIEIKKFLLEPTLPIARLDSSSCGTLKTDGRLAVNVRIV
jgi:hypothetical protein